MDCKVENGSVSVKRKQAHFREFRRFSFHYINFYDPLFDNAQTLVYEYALTQVLLLLAIEVSVLKTIIELGPMLVEKLDYVYFLMNSPCLQKVTSIVVVKPIEGENNAF